jgi:hypothetical protein
MDGALSLVELIVLNVGLSAGILNNRVFAMFVVMAVSAVFNRYKDVHRHLTSKHHHNSSSRHLSRRP